MALRGALTHRKTRKLAMLLRIPANYALGVVEALWHTTAVHAPTGAIGRMSNADLAMEMWHDGDADELVAALVGAGFLDEDRRHRLIVHNWHLKSDDAVDSRLYRAIELYANGAIPRGGKLGKEERAKVELQYREKFRTPSDNLFQVPRAAATLVPETSAIEARRPPGPGGSLPEPEPVPVPVPTTPLPPPAAGESRRQQDRRMAEQIGSPPGAALHAAADEVLRACSISGMVGVRVKASVFFAIENECKRRGWDVATHADEVGRLMSANYAEYVRAGPELRYQWKFRTFVEGGHWVNWQNWPVDQEKARMQQRAGVGMYVN